MKRIPLSQGFFSLVDDDVFDEVSKYKWCARVIKRADGSLLVYALRNAPRKEKRLGFPNTIFLHRVVLGVSPEQRIDHVDGNPLNNTRENLRICTVAQNSMNQRPRTDTHSGFKGVSLDASTGKWAVRIGKKGSNRYVGLYSSKEEAAKAYDAKAKELFGSFARLNFTGV